MRFLFNLLAGLTDTKTLTAILILFLLWQVHLQDRINDKFRMQIFELQLHPTQGQEKTAILIGQDLNYEF